MQPTLCSRCKKNVAVVFISRMNEKNEMVNEGLCLKCAAQLGLPQVEEMMKRMGITPEDLENINSEMMQAFGGAEEMSDLPEDSGEDDEESGKTATFPFLNRLFSNSSNPPAEQPRDNAGAGQQQPAPPVEPGRHPSVIPGELVQHLPLAASAGHRKARYPGQRRPLSHLDAVGQHMPLQNVIQGGGAVLLRLRLVVQQQGGHPPPVEGRPAPVSVPGDLHLVHHPGKHDPRPVRRLKARRPLQMPGHVRPVSADDGKAVAGRPRRVAQLPLLQGGQPVQAAPRLSHISVHQATRTFCPG